MNRHIFENLKIVKNSHQNTLGIIFLVILTLFFHNYLFIGNIKNMSVHYVLLFEIYQKPLSFRPYDEFTKCFTFIIAEKKVSENRI